MSRTDWDNERGIWYKECFTCKKVFDGTPDWDESLKIMLKHFPHRYASADGLRGVCISCKNKKSHSNRYGVSDEWKVQKLIEQHGRCEICSIDITFEAGPYDLNRACVDHDHRTGMVRGLICKHCNSGIGYMEHNSYILRKAIDYINKYSPTVIRVRRR